MACILLVEDEPAIRDLIAAHLTLANYQVITATDGVQALLVAGSQRPDVILMDIGLPKLNGWQTTQRLRARQDTSHIPIIALTAYALEADRQRAARYGCDAYETKPIDFASLLTKIRTVLEQRR